MELNESDLDRCVAEIKTLKSEVMATAASEELRVNDEMDKLRDETEQQLE
jgi:hypothetical protein